MQEPLVTPETAVLAKQAGFDWPVQDAYLVGSDGDLISRCDGIKTLRINYNKHKIHVSIPTQSHLQMWLREVKGIMIHVDYIHEWDFFSFTIQEPRKGFFAGMHNESDTYEQALEAALQTTLKHIIENQQQHQSTPVGGAGE